MLSEIVLDDMSGKPNMVTHALIPAVKQEGCYAKNWRQVSPTYWVPGQPELECKAVNNSRGNGERAERVKPGSSFCLFHL